MKNFFLISAIALFALLLFSSDSGAEEEFTISVDPGWMDEKERNCKTITETYHNGTYEYEECDYYSEYETNLTNGVGGDGYWSIGDDGTINNWENSASKYDWPLTPNSLNSTFVFSLHGKNFSKNIEYTFSYVVYSYLDHDLYMENQVYAELKIEAEKSQITLAESQITFFGNDSIETNLSGTFNGGIAIDSWISEDVETLVLKDECSSVFAHVKLEGKNVSTGNVSLSETYKSGNFFLNDSTRAKCKIVNSVNDPGFSTPSLHFIVVLMVISFVSFRKTKVNRGRNKDI